MENVHATHPHPFVTAATHDSAVGALAAYLAALPEEEVRHAVADVLAEKWAALRTALTDAVSDDELDTVSSELAAAYTLSTVWYARLAHTPHSDFSVFHIRFEAGGRASLDALPRGLFGGVFAWPLRVLACTRGVRDVVATYLLGSCGGRGPRYDATLTACANRFNEFMLRELGLGGAVDGAGIVQPVAGVLARIKKRTPHVPRPVLSAAEMAALTPAARRREHARLRVAASRARARARASGGFLPTSQPTATVESPLPPPPRSPPPLDLDAPPCVIADLCGDDEAAGQDVAPSPSLPLPRWEDGPPFELPATFSLFDPVANNYGAGGAGIPGDGGGDVSEEALDQLYAGFGFGVAGQKK